MTVEYRFNYNEDTIVERIFNCKVFMKKAAKGNKGGGFGKEYI